MVPKKCPRCQAPYDEIQIKTFATSLPAEFSGVTDEERIYLFGVLEILRSNDPVFAAGIRRAVDSYQHAKRRDLLDTSRSPKRSQ